MINKIKTAARLVRRYWTLYRMFVKNCLMAQMEFRLNFVMNFSIEVAFAFVKLLYIIVIFGAGVNIGGMSPYEITLCIGLYTFLTGIMDAVNYHNVSALPELVRTGDLDLYITKPVSLQFMVSFRQFDLASAIPNFIAGLAMILTAWSRLGLAADPGAICGFVFFSAVGLAVTYPLLMIPALLSFWIVKSDQLFTVIWSMWDFNNMPMGIYNRVIKGIGTFIVPIFLISNFAPLFVMHKLGVVYIVWSIVCAVLLNVLLRLFFRFAVRSYASASS